MESQKPRFRHAGIVSFSRVAFPFLIILLFLGCTVFSGCIHNEPLTQPGDSIILVTSADLQQGVQNATTWFLRNINSKGIFNYSYDPVTETYSTKNNMIRQLMASRLLAELSQTNESLQLLHQKNLDFIFTYWYKETNDTGYIFYDNKSKLGAIAMAVRTLVYSPFFEEYYNETRKLAQTILLLQHENGSFEPWYIPPDYTYDADYLLTFYSGEAILALLELYQKTNESVYFDAAVLSQEYYLEKYVKHLQENYYPAYVPWHTQSLYHLYLLTGNQSYADAILFLNDKLLELQERTNMTTLGRFYNSSTPQYGSPHSSSDAVYTEGLAYAYEIAVILNDSVHQEIYRKALVLAVHNLLTLQYHTGDHRIHGAVRYNVDDPRIRVDTTQHTLDAFRKTQQVFDETASDWYYYYDVETGDLFLKKTRAGPSDTVWFALTGGVILSIVVLFVVYLMYRKFYLSK